MISLGLFMTHDELADKLDTLASHPLTPTTMRGDLQGLADEARRLGVKHQKYMDVLEAIREFNRY